MSLDREKAALRVHILGRSLVFHTDADPKYLSNLIKFVENMANKIKGNALVKDEADISRLTCILLADKLFSEQRKKEEEDPGIEKKLIELMELIDNAIQE